MAVKSMVPILLSGNASFILLKAIQQVTTMQTPTAVPGPNRQNQDPDSHYHKDEVPLCQKCCRTNLFALASNCTSLVPNVSMVMKYAPLFIIQISANELR